MAAASHCIADVLPQPYPRALCFCRSSSNLTSIEVAHERESGEYGLVEPFFKRRTTLIALNRYAVGCQPADRKVATASTRETPLLRAAFPMSAAAKWICRYSAFDGVNNFSITGSTSFPSTNAWQGSTLGTKSKDSPAHPEYGRALDKIGGVMQDLELAGDFATRGLDPCAIFEMSQPYFGDFRRAGSST